MKNVFTSGDRTFSRKFKELFVTVKLDRQYSKDQILEWYLNTIYFGRGAYGIQAASQVYFGKPVEKLSVERGRGARVQHPVARALRPAGAPGGGEGALAVRAQRHGRDGQAGRRRTREAEVPEGQAEDEPPSLDDANKTWKGLIVRQVTEELEAADFDEARLNAEGLRVVTTIDREAQGAAVAAVQEQYQGPAEEPAAGPGRGEPGDRRRARLLRRRGFGTG